MTDVTATQLAPLTVRHSRRARRLAVRVFRSGRAEVVVPPRTSERVVSDFIAHHRDWIEARRQRAQHERPVPATFPPARLGLAAFGEDWSLRALPGAGRPRLVQVAPDGLEVRGAPTDAGLRQLLRAWVRARATLRLGPWLAALADETGLGFRCFAVRRQRTRWGSCSTRGTISLNACLAFQRPAVVRYLLLHELAHTQHMNHSSRFWHLVARLEPDWRRLDRELTAGWRQVPAWMLDDGD